MLEKIVITSLFVFAVWYTMLEGEIFSRLADWFYEHLPERLHQPAYDCPVCMAPWYGTVFYWLFLSGFLFTGQVNAFMLIEWLITILGATGLNAIISKFMPDDNDSR